MNKSMYDNIQSAAFQKEKKRLLAEVRIPSSIELIDTVTGGFKAGEISWIFGTSSLVKKIPYYLSVNTFETFGQKTLFIDGGNQLNPYQISGFAKQKECMVKEMLNQIYSSRAFTVHQLSTLITEKMESFIKRYAPKTVILNSFPQLYLDPDVSSHEAQILLNHHLQIIQRLTKKYQLVTLLTFKSSPFQQDRGNLLYCIENQVDEIIQMNMMQHCTRIVFPTIKKMGTITRGVYGQLSLTDFGMVR